MRDALLIYFSYYDLSLTCTLYIGICALVTNIVFCVLGYMKPSVLCCLCIYMAVCLLTLFEGVPLYLATLLDFSIVVRTLPRKANTMSDSTNIVPSL